MLAETALAQGILALRRLVLDLLLLYNAKTTTLTNNLDKLAVVQFVGAEDQLVVSQLVKTSEVIAFEPDY